MMGADIIANQRQSHTPPVLTARHALFLDFDGTLVDIAPTPEGVKVPEELTGLLVRVRDALGGALAVISGRDLNVITAYLTPLILPCAGTHGTERRKSDGTLVLPDPDVLAEAADMAAEAAKAVTGYPGMGIEIKPYSVVLHYRAAPEHHDACVEILNRLMCGRRHEWGIVEGKMIVEVRPAGYSKAGSVQAFMREPPFAGRIPVFVGDDRTDEDGIKAAMAMGGFGIKVGMGDSVASYRLADPQAVRRYLASTM
jgi:trehalose 6-phosphate phosphatase